MRVDVERIEGLTGRHEQAVAHRAPEAHIGASLRQANAPDELALRIVDDDAVELVRAHAPATPEIAVDIATEAVGRARPRIDEDLPIGEPFPIGDVEGKDEAVRRRARFDEVELRLIGREGKPVRATDVGRDGRRRSVTPSMR